MAGRESGRFELAGKLKPEQNRMFHVRPRVYTIYYGHLDRYGTTSR